MGTKKSRIAALAVNQRSTDARSAGTLVAAGIGKKCQIPWKIPAAWAFLRMNATAIVGREIPNTNSRGPIMNMLKNILTGVALLPLLPAIALAWLCVWITPTSSDETGANGNVINGRKIVRADTNFSITLAT